MATQVALGEYLRIRRAITRTSLMRLEDATGISVSRLWLFEHGRRMPTLGELGLLARALKSPELERLAAAREAQRTE